MADGSTPGRNHSNNKQQTMVPLNANVGHSWTPDRNSFIGGVGMSKTSGTTTLNTSIFGGINNNPHLSRSPLIKDTN
jgi:hypothetical protein